MDHAGAARAASGGSAEERCLAVAKAPGYRRREPENSLLHQTVRGHLKTFLAELEEHNDGSGLPRSLPHLQDAEGASISGVSRPRYPRPPAEIAHVLQDERAIRPNRMVCRAGVRTL